MFMDKHASDDAGHWAELRERVRALLRSAESVSSGPSIPASGSAADGSAGYLPAAIGPYRLIEKLGSGGVGTVYLAERILADTKVRAALKVLAPHAVDASFVERFHREQRLLASLDHPNITRLFDAGTTEDGQPYIVMEFVDG